MGSHQTSIGKEQERFTPDFIVKPLGPYDTDVCTGKIRPFDIASRNITAEENSLDMDWQDFGRYWCNPPFDRRVVGEFVRRMPSGRGGTLLLHVRTETKWFQPVHDYATAILWLAGRVIFWQADGSLCIVDNPKSKHYGKPANSGAPVALIAFGDLDADILAAASCKPEYRGERLIWPDGKLPGAFQPLRFARYVLVSCLEQSEASKTWREIVSNWLKYSDGPVSVSDLYVAFRDHPKNKSNPNWQAKLRQTLQRGAGKSVSRDQWVAA
jgi:hypothetical protein